ncbi:MAG: replicative DNA helicase [Deltaproteobacteria bacterium]|nr:MAG: replicative DNA helicase [Deltaproteobacteria bacterium]
MSAGRPRNVLDSDNALQRVPPHNLDAERAVLGGLLINNDVLSTLLALLSPDDFYAERHKFIYESILLLSDRSLPVDLITLQNILRERDLLEKVGGISYLTTLVGMVATTANIEHYARIVREKALLRTLISTAGKIAENAFNEEGTVEEILDDAERRIFSISHFRRSQDFVALRHIVKDSLKQIEKLYAREEEITGIPTGFNDLDAFLNGLQNSDLLIVAGRPSMGKTTLCLNIALNVALESRVPVGFFSLEMSKSQLAVRLLCAEARVNGSKARSGNLSNAEWKAIAHAAGVIAEAPIFIDDTTDITLMQMRAKARRLKAEHGLGLLIVDYLQLMEGSQGRENREKEIAQISRGMKTMAKEMDIPVIALSQLNRQVENREDKRPHLADLRESGSIEQDADVVLFIYRDVVYNKETPFPNVAEIIIAKQRNGPIGTVKLAFMSEYNMFGNLDPSHGEQS